MVAKLRSITRQLFIGFVAALVVLTASPQHVGAQITTDDFYSRNNISFYDPYSCTVGAGEGTEELVGNDNLEKILRYYVGKGLTLAQASGIAGNYQQESGFNPAIIQGGAIAGPDYKPVSGVGFGIAQWTWPGRQDPLVAMAAETNRKVIDLSVQLDYSWHEMENEVGHRMKLAEFKATTTPEDAAYIFHRDYEVSADSEEFVKKVRGGNARNIYDQFKSVVPDNASTASERPSGTCTGNGQASAFANDGFKIFNQNDPQWADEAYGESTIGAAGCGPSAMAMIITALTGETVTPSETAAYGAANGTLYLNGNGGSLHNVQTVIGGHWGLKSEQLSADVAQINQALRDGALIITSGSGPAPFTSGGHFIVIRGVTGDGKWLIGDSNGQKGIENSSTEWEPSFILSYANSGNIHALTK